MSPWLKPRLLALFCGALFIGGATTYLQAREDYGPPAKTPEEAAVNFWRLLDVVSNPRKVTPQVMDETMEQLTGSIVRSQFKSLSGTDSMQSGERFIRLLTTQAHAPRFEGTVQSSTDSQTIVSMAPSNSPKAREVVVVSEGGGYRVDMVATYGRWTGLKGIEADKSLYKVTGWVSPTLAQQSEFVGTLTQDQCQTNLKQIGLAVLMYSQDYDERLPPARKWCDVVYPYIQSQQIFTCPAVVQRRNGYAYNSKLSQFPLSGVASPFQTLQNYETSNTNSNVFAPFTGRAYRHTITNKGTGMNIGFVDGHVKWYRRGIEPTTGILPESYYGLSQ